MDFIASLAYSAARRIEQWPGGMAKLLLIVLAVVVAGGAVFLATWDMPAPTATVEKVIPNDRFQ
jgi:hypothetical protein